MAHHSRVRQEWVGPSQWTTWAAASPYAVGAYVIPTAAHLTGSYYKCTAITTGISGGTEPVWPTLLGNTVVDGGVTWTCEYSESLEYQEMAEFDANLAASVNGVDGGCYSPSSLITIGGSGLQCTGPLQVARGGTLITENGVIEFSYFPQLSASHAGRTKNVMVPFLEARRVPNSMWRVRRDSSGMQSIAPTYSNFGGGIAPSGAALLAIALNRATPAALVLPIRGIQGATISQITIGFRVSSSHTALPSTMPRARLLRIDVNGNPVPCTSIAAGADKNGWVIVPTPTSTAAWFNAGNGQTFVLQCDQNNDVDRTQYDYQLEVQDEQGLTGWPWQVPVLQPCRLLRYIASGSLGLPLSGLGAIDGVTPSQGDRVLVTNTIGNAETGVYLANTNTWMRAPDSIGQGAIVGIQQGGNYGGTYWQARPLVSSWTAGTTPPGTPFWQGSSSRATNTVTIPMQTPTGFWYQATTGGTTGSTEPSWPIQLGQTVQDNSVVWTCAGVAAPSLPWITRADVDTLDTGLALQGYGTIFESALVQFTDISQVGWQ